MRNALSGFLLIGLSATVNVNAQTPKWSTKVSLVTSIDDKELNNQFTSFVTREFRSLGDVNLGTNSSNWEYVVELIVTKVSNKADVSTGFAASVVMTTGPLEK